MKTQHCILTVALLCISALACHAAPGLDARAAIPPDPVSSCLTPAKDFAPIAISAVPACDVLWIHTAPCTPDVPVYLITADDLLCERTAASVAGEPRHEPYVTPLHEHGWYGAAVIHPAADWRWHSTWHPAGLYW